jgi:hypothetical protein
VSPLKPDEIREIIPLGNLNPAGGHVFPTDHIYLDYGGLPGLTVYAPAGGTITSIRDQLRGDLKVEIRIDENVSYYLAHLYLEPGIARGGAVAAGQKLGRASGQSMLDMGASDARVFLAGYANPERYPQPTLHAISPLKLFAEPLRGQLYQKVKRKGVDRDGKIDLDIPGRLVGNWFGQGLPLGESSRGDPSVWARQLCFAYDVRDRGAIRISIGGTIAPVGLYGVLDPAPDPAKVEVATGPVKFPLRRIAGSQSSRSDRETGILLIQLVDAQSLRAEYFTERSLSEVTGFTAEARIYER